MFGVYWSKFADATLKTKSNMAIFPICRADYSDCSGPIRSITELIQDLIIKYILLQLGADWLIFIDGRV